MVLAGAIIEYAKSVCETGRHQLELVSNTATSHKRLKKKYL